MATIRGWLDFEGEMAATVLFVCTYIMYNALAHMYIIVDPRFEGSNILRAAGFQGAARFLGNMVVSLFA